jgi:hypothetical protein
MPKGLLQSLTTALQRHEYGGADTSHRATITGAALVPVFRTDVGSKEYVLGLIENE